MRVREKGWMIAAAVFCVATSTFGVTLTQIGALTPGPGGAPASAVFAVTPDGAWAVGSSMGANSAGGAAMEQPVMWSLSTGLVQIPNTPAATQQGTSARGVAVDAAGNLVVAGLYYNSVAGTYRMGAYTTTPASPGTGTWASVQQHGPQVGTYNAARKFTYLDSSTTTAIVGRRQSKSSGIVAYWPGTGYNEFQTNANTPAGTQVTINSASSVPRNAGSNVPVGAGWDNGNPNALRRAVHTVSNSTTQVIIPGGSGYQSEAYGITPNSTQAAAVLVGYDQDTTASHSMHAFKWTTGSATMTMLGELSGGQSVATDVRMIAGNLIIAGSSWVDTTERAALWDSTGVWDSTGNPMLAENLLAAAGVDLSAWTSLTRVTTMSDNGEVFAGYGVWAADGSTRGFIAAIPEPATVLLLAFGGLTAVRRRR